MRPSMRKQLAWQAVGFCCYLGGMLLFLALAMDVYFSPPERSIENLSSAHAPFLVASLALFVLGSYVVQRFGGGFGLPERAPDRPQTRREAMLSEYGLHEPDIEEEESTDEPDYAYEDGDVAVRCPACGTKNDPSYAYCGECASEL